MIDKIVGANLIRTPSEDIFSILRQEGFVLSDQGGDDKDVGVLIEDDLINKVLTGKTYRLIELLMLYETIFGWVINGSFRGESTSDSTVNMYTKIECCGEETLLDLLHNLFQLESFGISYSISGRSESEEKIIKKFEENLRFDNGRYITRLLWKQEPVDLRDIFYSAKRQLDRLQKELKRDSFVCQQFEEMI